MPYGRNGKTWWDKWLTRSKCIYMYIKTPTNTAGTLGATRPLVLYLSLKSTKRMSYPS
jgi:hypothetical protein